MKQDLCALLRQNSYPGRGILLGRDAGGENAVIAYFIMGRSENSRNRVFEETDGGIRTRAYDESKMTDPSLIIYRPVRQLERVTIVTNGDQTATIYSALDAGGTFEDALLTRTFEPDEPNYPPRVSGLLIPYDKNGSREVLVQLSILKSLEGDPSCCCRQFYNYSAIPAGEGRFISTYRGDGSPLPSFSGDPFRVEIAAAGAGDLAMDLWTSLNAENRVSLFVRYIPLAEGEARTVIINKHAERR